jgi:hypothetical protein
MKKLFLPFLILFVLQIVNAQTTISVGTGTPVLDGVLNSGEWNATSITTSLSVTLNAMADGQYLYMSAQWSDATESIAKNRLTYDGSTWTKSGDEDRIAFIFDMGVNGTDGADCQTMCHIPVMSTNGGTVDLWHWKAVRSNPMGFVDDNYIDAVDRHGDPGTSAATDNILLSNGRPSFMSITDPGANADFLTKDDEAFNAFDPFGVMTSQTVNKSAAFDTNFVFANGDFVSGYLQRVSDGDRATVLAAGKWDSGVWTVEFKKPYAGTGFDFTVVPGSSVKFTHEIFDNEGSTHWTNGFNATMLTLDFSLITDVNDEAGNTPTDFTLTQNFPNPFNPTTKINFSVPQSGFVNIDVFNALGQKVTTLVNEQMNAGNYSTDFNAVNLTSGIYFYKMTSGNFTETRKMILLK